MEKILAPWRALTPATALIQLGNAIEGEGHASDSGTSQLVSMYVSVLTNYLSVAYITAVH
jgi:hypothetical protein